MRFSWENPLRFALQALTGKNSSSPEPGPRHSARLSATWWGVLCRACRSVDRVVRESMARACNDRRQSAGDPKKIIRVERNKLDLTVALDLDGPPPSARDTGPTRSRRRWSSTPGKVARVFVGNRTEIRPRDAPRGAAQRARPPKGKLRKMTPLTYKVLAVDVVPCCPSLRRVDTTPATSNVPPIVPAPSADHHVDCGRLDQQLSRNARQKPGCRRHGD